MNTGPLGEHYKYKVRATRCTKIHYSKLKLLLIQPYILFVKIGQVVRIRCLSNAQPQPLHRCILFFILSVIVCTPILKLGPGFWRVQIWTFRKKRALAKAEVDFIFFKITLDLYSGLKYKLCLNLNKIGPVVSIYAGSIQRRQHRPTP